jgi:hypothetical protein
MKGKQITLKQARLNALKIGRDAKRRQDEYWRSEVVVKAMAWAFEKFIREPEGGSGGPE